MVRLSLKALLSLLQSVARNTIDFRASHSGAADATFEYLTAVGLGHLSLHRPVCTFSHGERQRVALTTALGSNLVNLFTSWTSRRPDFTRRMSNASWMRSNNCATAEIRSWWWNTTSELFVRRITSWKSVLAPARGADT